MPSRRRLVRAGLEGLRLGANWCAIVMHSTDSLACALEVAEHLGLGEVGAVDGVRVNGVLQVATLRVTIQTDTSGRVGAVYLVDGEEQVHYLAVAIRVLYNCRVLGSVLMAIQLNELRRRTSIRMMLGCLDCAAQGVGSSEDWLRLT